jgi:hypothetical protein
MGDGVERDNRDGIPVKHNADPKCAQVCGLRLGKWITEDGSGGIASCSELFGTMKYIVSVGASGRPEDGHSRAEEV